MDAESLYDIKTIVIATSFSVYRVLASNYRVLASIFVSCSRTISFAFHIAAKNYIQSAYAISDKEKYEQETMSFQRTMDSFKKIIIVEKSMKPRYDENGYLMMGLKEFLLDANSLLI